MSHLSAERDTRTTLERLNPGAFVVWLHDDAYRVVFVEPGFLVLADHRDRTRHPRLWPCDWRQGRRSKSAVHALAIDDVLEKLRQLSAKGREAA